MPSLDDPDRDRPHWTTWLGGAAAHPAAFAVVLVYALAWTIRLRVWGALQAVPGLHEKLASNFARPPPVGDALSMSKSVAFSLAKRLPSVRCLLSAVTGHSDGKPPLPLLTRTLGRSVQGRLSTVSRSPPIVEC